MERLSGTAHKSRCNFSHVPQGYKNTGAFNGMFFFK